MGFLTSAPADNLWGAYTGSLADVRDPAVESSRTLAPPQPKGGWGRRYQQREWRPTVFTAPAASSSRPWRSSRATRRPTGNRFRWVPTGIYRYTEQAWNDLWQQYPDAEGDADFYYEPSSNEWFAKEWF